MITYAYLTYHIVPGPQSLSYFVPLVLLPVALLIPRTALSRWQSIVLFMPLMVVSTIHAWIQMNGIDVISVDVLLWALYLLVLHDPWNNFTYVGHLIRKGDDNDNDNIEQGKAYPPTLSDRIPWVGTLLSSIRLQGWKIGKHSHDIRQTRIHQTTTKAAFTKQALLSFIRGYIILDLTCAYQTHDSYFTDLNTSISSPLPFSTPTDVLFPRLLRSSIMAAQVWALISQFIYTPCLILIGLNALHWLPDEWSPHTWTPLFGDPIVVLDRGVRGFWGQYWHGAMRVLTVGPGEAVADFVGLNRRSLARYAVVTTITFGFSGVIHMGLVPPEPVETSIGVNEIRLHVAGFFWLQAFAVVVEAIAARATSTFVRRDFFDDGIGKGMKRGANLLWFMLWFSFCLPVFGEAARQLGYWRVWLVPVSLWSGVTGQGWIAWDEGLLN